MGEAEKLIGFRLFIRRSIFTEGLLTSFQDHARYMTSCFYAKMIRNFSVIQSNEYSTEEQCAALYNCYLEIKENQFLIAGHVEELEAYFTALKTFCETANT